MEVLLPALLITALFRSDARTIDGFTAAVKTQSNSSVQQFCSSPTLSLSLHFPLCLFCLLMISLPSINLSYTASYNCRNPAVTGLYAFETVIEVIRVTD